MSIPCKAVGREQLIPGGETVKRAVLALLLLLSLALFVRRPWFFDDPSVIITARTALQNPLHPYDYAMDLAVPGQTNWIRGGYPAYTHPPLSAWFLALVLRTAGESPLPLHAAMFALALASMLVVDRLFAEWSETPERAVFLWAFSPVFFLSALTLYPHFFYFFFYALSLLIARHLMDRGGLWVPGLGLSLTGAALSLHQWPVLVVVLGFFFWSRSNQIPWNRIGGAALLFVFLYGGWCLWESRTYGMPHLMATFHVRAAVNSYAWVAFFLPSVFLAGGLPATAMAWLFWWKNSKFVTCALTLSFAGLTFLFARSHGGFSLGQAVLLAFWICTAVGFFCAIGDTWKAGDKTDRFFIGWFLIEFIFVQKFLVFPSGHHLLEVALPATLLAVRLAHRAQLGAWGWRVALAASFLLVLALAQSDLALARIGPRVASDLSNLSGRRFFWGNDFSGYAYYLKRNGWRAYDIRRTPQPGDYLLLMQNQNAQGPAGFLSNGSWKLLGKRDYHMANPFRTWSISDAAGWYSASWGALPYSLSRGPAERVFLFQATSDSARRAPS